MQQIVDWLEKLGMSEYAERFAKNDIDFTILRDLTDQALEKIGITSTAYPANEIDAWAGRLRLWAQGKAPDDLPRVDVASAPRTTATRDVFAYVIHEGKIRAPAAAMALIERLKA